MHVVQNLALSLFLSLVSIDNLHVGGTGEAVFYVVSPSNDSEKFYLRLNNLGRARDERSEVREDVICAAILRSPFFATDNDVEIVDPNDVQTYTRFHPEMKDWFMFERPYEVVNVSVLQYLTRQEAVFPCLAKFKRTNELKMYFISHAYNFNGLVTPRQPNCPRATGRFVFEYASTGKNVVQLMAVAEESATSASYSYLSGDKVKRVEKCSGTICKFATGRKIRICSVVLNAAEYRPEITFLPLESRIEPKCVQKKVKLDWDVLSDEVWVIGCKAELVGKPGTLATYYVSLGFERYQLITYRPYEENGNDDVMKRSDDFYSHLGVNVIDP